MATYRDWKSTEAWNALIRKTPAGQLKSSFIEALVWVVLSRAGEHGKLRVRLYAWVEMRQVEQTVLFGETPCGICDLPIVGSLVIRSVKWSAERRVVYELKRPYAENKKRKTNYAMRGVRQIAESETDEREGRRS